MFEKIGRYAETVATSAGQSRRGFLGLLGQERPEPGKSGGRAPPLPRRV